MIYFFEYYPSISGEKTVTVPQYNEDGYFYQYIGEKNNDCVVCYGQWGKPIC